MSRSFKHNPIYKDGRKGHIIAKRFANKIVRKYKDKISKGKAYKRLFCSYNIHDFIIRQTWKQAKERYENDSYKHLKDRYPTLYDFYKNWIKNFKRK